MCSNHSYKFTFFCIFDTLRVYGAAGGLIINISVLHCAFRLILHYVRFIASVFGLILWFCLKVVSSTGCTCTVPCYIARVVLCSRIDSKVVLVTLGVFMTAWGGILCECEIDLSSISEDRMFHTQRQNWLSERRVLRTCLCSDEPGACAQRPKFLNSPRTELLNTGSQY